MKRAAPRLVAADDGVFEFDLASYRANIEAMIGSGDDHTSFREAETWREVRELGPDVVHGG